MRPDTRQQRGELRRTLARMRQQARERLAQDPRVQRARKRRQRRRAVGLLLLLLLVLLVRCDCEPPPPPPPPEVAAPAVAPKPPAVAKPSPPAPKPLKERMERKPRAAFPEAPRRAPAWLEAYRLQVAARSARLAACFEGAERPGALRWTASVNPESGGVSEHALEPVGTATAPDEEQRTCVLQVLSRPAYRLRAEPQALPTRISLVVEF